MSMSATKYASLPDIDTAPDVYETEDVFPTHDTKNDSSDEEPGLSYRAQRSGKGDTHAKPDELNTSSLMDPAEAGKKFRKAEKRQHRPRILYTYPASPTSSGRSSPELSHRPSHHARSAPTTVNDRLERLRAELAALEAEVQSAENRDGDAPESEAGELIKEVADVKTRLEKIGKMKESAGKAGREKLVHAMLQDGQERDKKAAKKEEVKKAEEPSAEVEGEKKLKLEVKDIAEMDRRLGELEKAVGASSAVVDETTPLPPPLLPLLTRLNNQLTLLAQPRHIDNISRRLKLLLTDLDRLSAANAHGGTANLNASRRGGSGTHALGQSAHGLSGSLSASTHGGQNQGQPVPPSAHPHTDALAPILTRLSPLLPHVPHILTRLRTLSTLHTNAAAFQSTLESLEEEQKRVRKALEELEGAVQGVEGSLKENEAVVKGNVLEVEKRVDDVVRRVEAISAHE